MSKEISVPGDVPSLSAREAMEAAGYNPFVEQVKLYRMAANYMDLDLCFKINNSLMKYADGQVGARQPEIEEKKLPVLMVDTFNELEIEQMVREAEEMS